MDGRGERLKEKLEDQLKGLWEKKFRSSDANKPKQKPLIKWVTPVLRDNKDFEPYFKPIAVAFGPLHDGRRHPRLQRGEKSKIDMAAKFIEYSGRDIGVFHSKVKAEIKSLKECYDPKQIEECKDDEDLTWRFLVDGCAVLLFVDYDANDKLKALEVKDDLLAYVKLDLFLLENQLPYRLLQILMDNCNRDHAEALKSSIDIFINKNAMSPVEQELQKHRQRQRQPQPQQQLSEIRIGETQLQQQQQKQEEGPAHLLDLLWRRLAKSEMAKESDGTICKLLKKSCKKFCILKEHSGSKDISPSPEPRGKTRHYRHTFRNVKELKEKGILLKVSRTSNIRDISFKKSFCAATLRLPPITVDYFTGPKLMNLIAYEMCPDFKNEFEITSYVSFLDSLIDQAEDVKELRDAGVLQNGLGSDRDVALLFNRISKNLVPNPKLHSALRLDIQAYCHTLFAIYVAQFYHTYFSSPWSFWAFLGALLGLGLTAVQTYEDFRSHPPPPGPFNP